MADTSNRAQFLTSGQRLDRAVKRYWQIRYPGRPGRVILVDRTHNTQRKAA